jgi:Trk K+ transport system NAD-binding subunit
MDRAARSAPHRLAWPVPRPASWRLWREWCFARAILVQARLRLLVLAVLLAGSAALMRVAGGPESPGWVRALYDAWFLILGNPTRDMPAHPLLRVLFFLLPLLGLVVIIETLVDISLLVRDRRQSERAWCSIMAGSMSAHVVLVGCGKLGFRTFKILRNLGEEVVVIENDERKPFLDEVRRDGAPLLIGDARQDRLLLDANIARAKAIVLATSDDLVNLEVALDARRLSPQIRVVLRMFDQVLADKVARGANIHIAMSQSAISAPTFATAAVAPSIVASTVVGERLVITRRLSVRAGGPWAGRTVGQLMTDLGVAIVERVDRGGASTLFPPPQAALEAGDAVLVQGPYHTVARLGE